MNKEARRVNGRWQFLLGTREGETYWLEQGSFDCDWYWRLGYVESYRGHGTSDRSWTGHSHFDSMFLKKTEYGIYIDAWKKFFEETPLTDDEIWEVLELMKSAYTCRQYSDMLHTGGSHITSKVKVDLINNDREYGRLNNAVIPVILNKVYEILLPKNEDGTIYGTYPLDEIYQTDKLGTYTKWGDEEEE